MRLLAGMLVTLVVLAGCGSEDNGTGGNTPSPETSAADTRISPTVPSDDSSAVDDTLDTLIDISKQEFGEDWPLTVDHGTLGCYETYGIVFTAPDGIEYTVNGTAKSADDLKEIDEIWADDPQIDGAKINIGPLIDRGLELCS